MSLLFSIDDMNTTLIKYKGDWEAVDNGSTRQWDSTIHTTGQTGASATFQFRGYLLWVWGTIPGGIGQNKVELTVDGGPVNVTSQTSNGTAIFNVIYFETPLLTETFHTAVITNLGSTSNGSTEFQLDRFEFQTSDVVPLFSPQDGVSSSSSTSTPTPSDTSVASTSGHSPKSPLRAIAGGVVGALAFVIILLLFVLWKRAKKGSANSTDTTENPKGTTLPRRSVLIPRPFPLNYQADVTVSQDRLTTLTPSGPNSLPLQSNAMSLSGKSGYQKSQLESSCHWTPVRIARRHRGLISLTTVNTVSSVSPITHIGSAPGGDISLESLEVRRDAPGNHRRHALESLAPLSPSSSNADIHDNPPPSYWYKAER